MKLSKIAKTATGSIWTWDDRVDVVPASVFLGNPKAKGWFLKAGAWAEIEIEEFFKHEDIHFDNLSEVKEWLKTSSFTKSEPINTPTPSSTITDKQREEFFKEWSTAQAHPEDIAEGMIA